MKKYLFLVVSLLMLTACGSSEKGRLKKSFAEMVSKKVQAASVHSLGCKTGDPVYSDVKKEIEKKLKVSSGGEAKSAIVKSLCEQGVKMAFPYIIAKANGKLPDSWASDGCSTDSVFEDIQLFAAGFCSKLE